MNEEEKKAIEYTENCLMKITLGIDCEFDVNILDTLLNIIKKLQKENEELRVKWDKDTHILQNKLDYANADRIDLAQQNKELRKENEELNNRCRNLDKEAQAYLEELAGDNTLTRRTIKQLQEENEELKNNTRKNENELEFDIDCDWIALQKMLDESEKSNEYISYKNEKWIKEKYCIPIQKIKAKIEELDIAISECIYLDDDDEEYKKAVKKDKLCLLNQKRALQELLEGGQS